VKRYEVHKNARKVLSFSAEPGVLLSTALRPEGFKAPAHPFVNAQAHDPRSEEQLAGLLGKAKSVEEFIALLEKEGFEVSPT
jgi:hypothetical protein